VGRVRCEREIKRSKFIAIAASVPDERAALSFLNEVILAPALFIF
jgi:putative IMPACT (imprinted ancient) family translation regulator